MVRLETTAQMVSLLTVHSTDLLGQKTRQPFLQSCLRARQWSTGEESSGNLLHFCSGLVHPPDFLPTEAGSNLG